LSREIHFNVFLPRKSLTNGIKSKRSKENDRAKKGQFCQKMARALLDERRIRQLCEAWAKDAE